MSHRSRVGVAPRLLPNLTTQAGRAYLDAYRALEERFGPFADRLMRMEAGRAAFAWVELQASAQQLAAARAKFTTARGRHGKGWNAQAIARLSKRLGLNDATYVAAVRRLEELVTGANPHQRPLTPAELLSRIGHGASSSA